MVVLPYLSPSARAPNNAPNYNLKTRKVLAVRALKAWQIKHHRQLLAHAPSGYFVVTRPTDRRTHLPASTAYALSLSQLSCGNQILAGKLFVENVIWSQKFWKWSVASQQRNLIQPSAPSFTLLRTLLCISFLFRFHFQSLALSLTHNPKEEGECVSDRNWNFWLLTSHNPSGFLKERTE
jgi:hypothetical protein